MTAIPYRKTVLAIVPEASEGALLAPSSANQYTAMQDDATMSPDTEKLENKEMRSTLAPAKSTLGAESPKFNFAHYLRGSGTEGVAPDYNDAMKALMGAEVVAGTEYDTISGSTTSLIKVDTGEGVNYQRGQAVLVKHATYAWEVGIVLSVSGDDLTMAFKLKNAPAAGTKLGKCVLWKPADSGHITTSVWRYLGNGGGQEAVAGWRPTELGLDAPAGQYVNGSFSGQALAHYVNPIEITSSTKYIDFEDDDGVVAAALATGWYKNPHELAAAASTAMDAANPGQTHTVTYDDATGQFTFKSTGTLLSLLWSTGTNNANDAAAKFGFSGAADNTGTAATTGYTGSALSWASPYTPTLDSADPVSAKGGVFYVGDAADNTNCEASNVSGKVSNDLGINKSICAETGNAGSLFTGRKASVGWKERLSQNDVQKYRRYCKGTQTQVLYVWGPKVGGNFVAGQTMGMLILTASLTKWSISQENGLVILDAEAESYGDAKGNGEVYFFQL